jgi:hypothetical protein
MIARLGPHRSIRSPIKTSSSVSATSAESTLVLVATSRRMVVSVGLLWTRRRGHRSALEVGFAIAEFVRLAETEPESRFHAGYRGVRRCFDGRGVIRLGWVPGGLVQTRVGGFVHLSCAVYRVEGVMGVCKTEVLLRIQLVRRYTHHGDDGVYLRFDDEVGPPLAVVLPLEHFDLPVYWKARRWVCMSFCGVPRLMTSGRE